MITTFKASAPGRLDVMGGISDYSGALVLQMPLQETTEVEVKPNTSGFLVIESNHDGKSLGTFKILIQDFLEVVSGGDAFRHRILLQENGYWAVYPSACLAVLVQEKGLSDLQGLEIHITSTVPLGKGVSSSAAIEVATIRALALWKNLTFEGTELAILAQRAENHFVGAPCGLMDQLTSSYGNQGSLLPILCQPDVLYPVLVTPSEIGFYGLDSGVKHEVVGASYADVRTATSMGYAILAYEKGCSKEDLVRARFSGSKSGLPFAGHLANISLSDFLRDFRYILPETMTGKEFIEVFGETADPYARINEESTYSIRTCTQHPIEENYRTHQFMLLLNGFEHATHQKKESLRVLGELMFLSHLSYSRCGLGHPRTNELVEMVRENLGNGVFGAKITGGGSGGTVCVLSYGEEGKQTVKEIHRKYGQKYRKELLLIDPNPIR